MQPRPLVLVSLMAISGLAMGFAANAQDASGAAPTNDALSAPMSILAPAKPAAEVGTVPTSRRTLELLVPADSPDVATTDSETLPVVPRPQIQAAADVPPD